MTYNFERLRLHCLNIRLLIRDFSERRYSWRNYKLILLFEWGLLKAVLWHVNVFDSSPFNASSGWKMIRTIKYSLTVNTVTFSIQRPWSSLSFDDWIRMKSTVWTIDEKAWSPRILSQENGNCQLLRTLCLCFIHFAFTDVDPFWIVLDRISLGHRDNWKDAFNEARFR